MHYPGAFRVVEEPAEEPVTLEEAKLHLRVEHDDDDAWIQREITAARCWCETMADRTFLATVYEYNLDAWPAGDDQVVYLPRPPLQAVDSVLYVDADGAVQSIDVSAGVQVDTISKPGRILPAYGTTWPTVRDELHPISIRYTAGYGTKARQVEPDLITALRLRLADLYENRESIVVGTISSEIPSVAAINLLRSHRTSWTF